MDGQILNHVEGTKGKFNSVYLYKKAEDIVDKIVIFFPGDVQEFYDEMLQRRDTRWKEFCFENCAKWLHKKFKNSCVWVVKASRMHLNTFACYKHFLHTNEFGTPFYQTTEIMAWNHLSCLIKNLKMKSFPEDLTEKYENLPIHLVSFSKGCVVLNQLIHELPVVIAANKEALFSTIKDICFLDNGVPGNSGAWVTKDDCVKLAVECLFRIEINTSPYQMKDTLRPWIAKEKKRFVQLLKKYNGNFTDIYHFEDQWSSLEVHFQLIKVYTCEGT